MEETFHQEGVIEYLRRLGLRQEISVFGCVNTGHETCFHSQMRGTIPMTYQFFTSISFLLNHYQFDIMVHRNCVCSQCACNYVVYEVYIHTNEGGGLM
jgi:hypothetical protein